MAKNVKSEDMTTRIAHRILEKVRVIKDSLPVIGRRKKKTGKKTSTPTKTSKKTSSPKTVSKKKTSAKKRAPANKK